MSEEKLGPEGINATCKEKMSAALKAGNLQFVRDEDLAQVEAGADIPDVNTGVAGYDEVDLMS